MIRAALDYLSELATPREWLQELAGFAVLIIAAALFLFAPDLVTLFSR